jgi:hypothetical protein
MQRRCEQDSTLFLTPELGELTLLTSNEMRNDTPRVG